ncbi:MAG: hypothetical protein KDC52_06280, partial [Ignavibacteriae bacterium]|nr:hypothetical protein [Ignavibacteriota bacterium]
LGWETGNELASTNEWQSEIARYIKSIDKNHLVIENPHSSVVSEESINDPNLDVLSTHFYEPSKTAVKKILMNSKLIEGKKPYFVGEFGFIPSYQFEEILDTVINSNVSGALLWSLRFRNRDGGFYKHYEKLGFGAYNFPGFSFNQPYDEKSVLKLIQNKAEEISKNEDHLKCDLKPPKILPTNSVYKISWQGSTGASSYVIQRKELENDWDFIDVIDDSKISYKPLYSDLKAEKGKSYFYRMRAWNGREVSDLSNEIGPIKVEKKILIDELFNEDLMYEHSDNLKFLSVEDLRKAKEERSRVTGDDGSYLIYELNEPINEFDIDVFHPEEISLIKVFGSADGNSYSEIFPKIKSFEFGKNDYGFFKPVSYSQNSFDDQYKFLKIIISGNAQISKIEIAY